MQEIKKRRIVIASVLKPVNDTRMFEKLGLSLAKVAEVHIIGFPGPTVPSEGVVFHSSRAFSRLSLRRLIQAWKVFGLLVRLRPTDVIITTHELLWPAVLYKILFRAEFCYDLQENYWRNIRYTEAFPRLLRPLLAGYVRLKERLLHRFVHRYLVAEKAYLDEIPFIRTKSVLLENRYKDLCSGVGRAMRRVVHGKRLIFSGTLSRSTGVFAAVALARKLFALDPAIRLSIAGFCPRPGEYRELLTEIKACSFITLHGGNALIPHPTIIQHMRESDFGVIAYDLTPATTHRLPTKIYEYLANGLTLITVPHRPWLDLIRQYQEPILFDPAEPDAHFLLEKINAVRAQPVPVFDCRGLLWEESESALLSLFPPFE